MPEFLKSIAERLHDSAAVKSVYGEPIAANVKTIIPVARIAYGFGGGAGKRLGQGKPAEGEGEGGGGGVVAIPVGVVEVTDAGTRFVTLHAKHKLAAAGLIGLCLGLFWGRLTKRLRDRTHKSDLVAA
jgi:uncharacterized spore protein YtfJ